MAERGGELGGQTVWRRWWPSGAITPAVLVLNEGKTNVGEGKQQGRRPLRGGDGADREAAECGGTPALGR
jgi:hypothetical protein